MVIPTVTLVQRPRLLVFEDCWTNPVGDLNGGFQAWKQTGMPISTELETPLPSDFPTIQLNWLAQATEVEAQLNKPEVQLLDARPNDFLRASAGIQLPANLERLLGPWPLTTSAGSAQWTIVGVSRTTTESCSGIS